MFILKVHSWRFLGIFEIEKNLSDAYKEVYVVFVGRLPIFKKFSLKKKTFSVRQFHMLTFSHKRTPFPNRESYYSKWAMIS